MKAHILLVLIPLLAACGPMMAPAIRRLAPDEQAQVDGMWNNLLAKPDRLDRELLLDVMIVYQLHQLGVDKANYHAEKEFVAGTVLMDVSFDRKLPLDDWFVVSISDTSGRCLRKERYTGEEVWSHLASFTGSGSTITRSQGPDPSSTTSPGRAATQPTDAEAHAKWLDARMQQIVAATQPAK